MEFYTWQTHRCAFEQVPGQGDRALLLIHPIGVGLSRRFWQPFIQQWTAADESTRSPIYNPDLLGCGDSDMPARAYVPEDWAEQLAYFIDQVVQKPVILVVQGALLPVAVRLMALPAVQAKGLVKGLVLSGPPAWRLMTTPTAPWKQQLSWQLFDSLLGNLFYRYARREAFLRSFSQRQLFERPEDVTADWLAMLHAGSQEMASRYAVFSFLAGFWRQNYAAAIAHIDQPTLIVMGVTASPIDRTTARQTDDDAEVASQQRLQTYLERFPHAQGIQVTGRNVMPYESAAEFAQAIAPFIASLAN